MKNNEWIVKGYHTGPNSKGKDIFTKEGQYVADAIKLAKSAMQAGCDEILILKRGRRDGIQPTSRSDYYASFDRSRDRVDDVPGSTGD
ncbi:unnamed protein product [marine sediment metagenome]|uniref:DUF2188 domain-containing protein n=1 Tax=marine sediment metagenome TaxID=412755 RepID=X0XQZ5_9ZZZZ